MDRRFGYDADDRHKIETVAAAVTESPSDARQLIAEVDRRAEQLVALHWCAVTALARELARRRTLDGDAIDLILRPFKVHGRTTVERDRVYEENGKPVMADFTRQDGSIR